MRVYVGAMGYGEIPRLCVKPPHQVVTIQDGQVRSARVHDAGPMCYAYERWFSERHDISFDRARDLIDQVSAWNLSPSLDFRPAIREELINELRLMGTRTAVVFVRHYSVGGIPEGPVFATLAAGALGMDIDPELGPPVFRGPFWDSLFERNVDGILSGEDWPPGMKRYAITPWGRIINPWPLNQETTSEKEAWDARP